MTDEPIPLENSGIQPERKTININGRFEHEEWLKNPQKMIEYGLDPYFETMVYLKRWGGWLDESR